MVASMSVSDIHGHVVRPQFCIQVVSSQPHTYTSHVASQGLCSIPVRCRQPLLCSETKLTCVVSFDASFARRDVPLSYELLHVHPVHVRCMCMPMSHAGTCRLATSSCAHRMETAPVHTSVKTRRTAQP